MPQKIDEAINAAFSTFYHPTIVPITYLEQSKIYLAELFHGPTGSFKDLALQLLPRLILNLLLPHEKHVYLVATSGDTGGKYIYVLSFYLPKSRFRILISYLEF